MSDDKNFIQWKNEYIVGNIKIDSEHKKLFEIARKANDIYLRNDKKEQKKSLNAVVDELYSYVNKHFKNEEKYMASINYPLLKEHKILHTKLLEMLNFISLNLPILSVSKSGNELYNFVQNVFVRHIVEEDIKLVNYINNKL
ncbi:bacteriohemerythrin [Arcobacter sp. LA11]|uniref:bacteriohemerythrin n=1 Tax=Arcobacter sp. LA11 TaxID=1898176 RepID=UPI000934D2B4|nr:hemerythrin family protein [Arcobacter sp. LA11]